MSNLDRKYLNDTLTSEELEQLRKLNATRSDQEIEEMMRVNWEAGGFGGDDTSSSALLSIKAAIDKELFDSPSMEEAQPKSKFNLSKFTMMLGRVAAAIAIPLLVVGMLYLYHQNDQLQAKTFVASTGYGEKVTLTLPDHSQVTLNSNSMLEYNLANFNKEEREVEFEGEGYFKVTKDPEKEFIVNAPGVEVKVLGTTFNLKSRTNEEMAELALEEGKVEFSSTKTGESMIVMPNQVVTLNKTSGEMNLIPHEDLDEHLAWTRSELVFRNATLSDVLQEMSKAYSIEITMDKTDLKLLDDRFTGTLSSNNINDAFEVLEHSYNRKVIFSNGKVKFEKY